MLVHGGVCHCCYSDVVWVMKVAYKSINFPFIRIHSRASCLLINVRAKFFDPNQKLRTTDKKLSFHLPFYVCVRARFIRKIAKKYMRDNGAERDRETARTNYEQQLIAHHYAKPVSYGFHFLLKMKANIMENGNILYWIWNDEENKAKNMCEICCELRRFLGGVGVTYLFRFCFSLCVCAAAKKRGDTKKEQATESVGSICDALWVRHCFALRLRKQQQTWNEIYWCRGHDFNVQNFVTLTHAHIGTKFLHTHRQDKIK